MKLYLVQHTHTPDRCPGKNLDMVRQLSAHMSAENAARFGVKILADWVNDEVHTAVFVLQADSREKAEEFAKPFGMVGTVSIKEGTTCQELAARYLQRKAA